MLPKYLKVVPPLDSSFHVRYERAPYFNNPWHFHPELELTYIIQSTGTRFVGDNIENFGPGDIVMIGSNLPHFWKNDQDYYQNKTAIQAEAIVIRFSQSLFGGQMEVIPELDEIKQLFETAKRGIKADDVIKDDLIDLIVKTTSVRGLERFILMLEIFRLFSSGKNNRLLCSKGFDFSINANDENRLKKIHEFLLKNFNQPISLDEVAELAHMHPSAFSRYFSQRTGKSFTAFLQELRISYVCRLLTSSNLNICEILFEAGFRNQANFNKLFRKKFHLSPYEYRKQHQSKS